jgi:heavy metal sensor kinase
MLAGLACVFGGLLFANVRRSMERDVDSLLRTRAAALAEVIAPAAGGKFYIELSPELVESFRGEGEGATYYAIWQPGGEIVDSSHPALRIPVPRGRGSRDRAGFRELTVRGPAGTWILVGKDVQRERRQLKSLAAIAVGVGTTAMLLMLAGGWFLTSRALAPIERISRAASAVSASNLCERIDASQMEAELAELANTINDAFDRLQRAFDQQARFTADASHELRTPLAIVLSHVDLALKRERSNAEYRETLATVRRAALRMKGVIEGLLTLARADAGRIHLARERLDLSQLIVETCSLLRPLAQERQVTLVHELQAVDVWGDRDRLSEAVANLLTNAIRYNQREGRVDVSLHRRGAAAVLKIADTGPGIPEAVRPHIFERFYRLDEARSGTAEGSGLGLAITKWIVDAHGGSIHCTDGDLGGALFVVELRAAPPR